MSDNEKKKEINAPDDMDLLDDPKHLLEKCERERDEYLNGWKRAKADLINHERDEAKRIEAALKSVKEETMRDLLPVLESFDLALQAAKDVDGLGRVHAQLKDVLKQHGLAEIVVGVGEAFNPEFHEAVGEVESEVPSGTVAEEVRRGYTLYGRTIKAAQVRLSK